MSAIGVKPFGRLFSAAHAIPEHPASASSDLADRRAALECELAIAPI